MSNIFIMSDIFISYARADRPRAERLARTLGRHGWTVWWDRDIPPGKTFAEVIEEALTRAKCVIVLWSSESVRSEWVKIEAAEAARRGILVPVLADDITIPLEFRRIQTARFANWQSLLENPDWEQLSQAVAALVGRPAVAPAPVVKARWPSLRTRWATAVLVGVVALGALVAGYVYLANGPAAPGSNAAPPPSNTIVLTPESGVENRYLVPSETPPPEPVEPIRPRRAGVVKVNEANERTLEPRPSEQPLQPLRSEAPAVIPGVIPDVTGKKADPRSSAGGAVYEFDVTYTYSVFREQAGQLSISSEGLRFHETTGDAASRAAFEASCGEVKRVAGLNLIADREQRTLEIGTGEKSYRLKAAHAAARDEIMAALSRICGPR
jgi:hypothetical protein